MVVSGSAAVSAGNFKVRVCATIVLGGYLPMFESGCRSARVGV